MLSREFIIQALLALAAAGVISFALTPPIKLFAYKVGAVDVPRDKRRMHKEPIPRLGGLAIFFGFLFSILFFGQIDSQMRGILLGAIVIVSLGVVDDIVSLPALFKFAVQIGAALIPVLSGVRIERFSNPNVFSNVSYIDLGMWSIPLTVLWIVGITNAVNLIDGLDGLAVGVSSIASLTLVAIAVLVSEPYTVAIVMAALAGACIGFLPYNLNPAKIFMGDTGATFLGFILATVSVQGLFKFYAIVSFAVPFLVLGLPIFDTAFAVIRRVLRGESPMKADRGHVHHRLIDMGFSQKQAVAILYTISAIFGLSAVLLATSGKLRAVLGLAAFIVALLIGAQIFGQSHEAPKDKDQTKPAQDAGEDISKEKDDGGVSDEKD